MQHSKGARSEVHLGRYLLHKQEGQAGVLYAINSMYKWYAKSEVCYAYVDDVLDVNDEDEMRRSEYFTRGWTLQEILAPEELIFFFPKTGKIPWIGLMILA